MDAHNSTLDIFLQTLCTRWKLNPVDINIPSLSPIFEAQNNWGHVCVLKNMSYDRKSVFRTFRTQENLIIICITENEPFIDVYAQSMMDPTPVMALDVPWQNNETFWNLEKQKNYTLFCLELSKRFGKSHLENKFVSNFKKYTQKLAQAWQNINPDSENSRQTLALNTLIRLLFLTFLASKGILDKREYFLQEEAQKCDFQNQNIYCHLIQPLFFETLNRPHHRRTQRVKKFGQIPFLNGGLFTPGNIEIQSPDLTVPNYVLKEIIDQLFGQYPFNTEIQHNTRQLNLDPLMLGHVFESLMSPQQRAATGTFYTPVPMAKQIINDVFKNYIHKFIDPEYIQDVLNYNFNNISLETTQKLETQLSKITILDPASGSGTFLQCAFEWLHNMRTALNNHLNKPSNPEKLARQILTQNIFGIDIIPMANQLCELRLWLELVRFYPQNALIPPLPNLDLNIVCGDTLTDLSQYRSFLDIPKNNDYSPKLAHLKRKYRLASGKTKKKLADQISLETRESSKKLFESLIAIYHEKIQMLEKGNLDLFTKQPFPTFKQTKLCAALKQQKDLLQRSLQDNDMIPAFNFDLHFGDILKTGGFDIIIGNPPWFSLHTLPKTTQSLLKQLYQTTTHTCTTQRQQSVDISALFIEKSIQCVRNNGIIAMLIPNKLFYAPSYETFRLFIQNHAQIIQINDWSHAKHNTFQATAYPSSIILKKCNLSKTQNQLQIKSNLITPNLANTTHPVFSKFIPTIEDVFKLRRGIITGANHLYIGNKVHDINSETSLFTITSSKKSSKQKMKHYPYSQPVIADDPDHTLPPPPKLPNHENTTFPIESHLLRPVLKGANIRPYVAIPNNTMIFTHDPDHPNIPLRVLPPLAQNWFQKHKHTLATRLKSQSKPYYTLTGTFPELNTPKVVWRDISKELEAAFVKDNTMIPINTVYYIPVPNENIGYLLTAWLNSKWARQFCRNIAEHARGDYRRYFTWVVGKLPWPFESLITSNAPEIQKIIQLSQKAHDTKEQNQSQLHAQIEIWIEKCLNHCSQTTNRRQTYQTSIPFHTTIKQRA